ncbi:unnamed protein product [Ceutorhynchus assimilis]|uniref:CN hydrolase domain-containing protein n=1 Tax=Ceutorhynchus assimilis TaxID=467358 RepID=A0A9N9MQJ2_9CUCU|nr:unnamed protein product [Ceutorhynchus assimilis]
MITAFNLVTLKIMHIIVAACLLDFFIGPSLASYNVALIELPPNLNYTKSLEEILEENTNNYLDIIENVTKNQTLDLIIFPESTLTPYFSTTFTSSLVPSSDVILCNSTDTRYQRFLRHISCAAVLHSTTIVINFTEEEIDESGNKLFYNTNVALGTDGTVLARYRKYNLFGERGKTRPEILDLPVITIKNTTFGIMTCFDIQFGKPGFNLVKEKRVENIIFPLNWISELPYLTALQTEQMWAQEMDVVLLAAGASYPETGAGGSGIFLGARGAQLSEISPTGSTNILIGSVSDNVTSQKTFNERETDDLASSMDDFFMLVDPTIKDHNSVILDLSQENFNATVCHEELCCDFSINISVSSSQSASKDVYTYHLVAFNGVRTYSGFYYGGVETCGIVACLNGSVDSCGRRFSNYSTVSWPITFNSIEINGNFTPSKDRIQYPTTLLSSIRPLAVQDYSWKKTELNSTIQRSIVSLKPQNRLLTFGIFGRDFERDREPLRSNSECKKMIFSVLILVFLLKMC